MTATLKGQLESAAAKREDSREAAHKLIASCQTAGSMTLADSEKIDQLIATAEDADRFITKHQTASAAGFSFSGEPSDQKPGVQLGTSNSGLMNLATGQPINLFRGQASMAESANDFRIAEGLFNWLRGQPVASTVGGVDSSGGFIIAPQQAPFVVDLSRARNVAVAAGAASFVMDSPEVRIGKITGEPTPQWRAELQGVTASNVRFGLATMRARKQVCLLFVSDEWAMDASNGVELLNSTLAAAMSNNLDKMIFQGTGAENELLGILNEPDRNTVTSIGNIADFADLTDGVKKILNANYSGDVSKLALVLNPEVAADYDGLADSTGQPLQRPRWASSLREFNTTNLPTTTGVIGDFSQILIGARSNGIRFEVLDAGSASDGTDTLNAVSQVGRWVRLIWYGDSVCLKPTHFCTLEGITV